MKIDVNGFSIDYSVIQPTIPSSGDLEVRIVFTNTSKRETQLNALFLDFAVIVLEVQTDAGASVSRGAPPMPPIDDGKAGRVRMAAGDSHVFAYKGSHYFGSPLPPGKYQVRFRYKNENSEHGDWTGSIETGWMKFEVRPD